MKDKLRRLFVGCTFVVATFCFSTLLQAADTIRIGLNLPLSGARASAGQASRAGAEMVRDAINAKGGLQVGAKKYTIEFVEADNQSDVQIGVSNVLKLITRENVIGIVGPLDSSRAIPAGGISNAYKTPMISPTSTNPRTTIDRPYVFRACFLDPFQGEAMASFAISELGAKTAAVLYNIADAYPKGLAEFFKAAFEAKNGEGSIVAFENFPTNEKDLSAHLKRIVDSGADVLFLPQYDNEVPDIVKQAKEVGWDKVIMGGDAWETPRLIEQCGEMCKGFYFSSHFAAIGAEGKSKAFVESYEKKMGTLPTGDGALGYDAVSLMVTAISSMNSLSDNMTKARDEVKDKLASLKGFQGVSGVLDMTLGGDPVKSAAVIQISDDGKFILNKTVNP